ncbi:MAG: hypothetical protein WDZ26_03905 [Nitriliruptoraceae bacterium]
MTATPARRPDPAPHADPEAGFVAGADALLIGVLVFVMGTLVALNAWAVVDARFAAAAAAREAVRAAVETPAGADPHARAVHAGRAAYAAHGRDVDQLHLEPEGAVGLARCQRIRYRAVATVPSTIVPGIWSTGGFEVTATHSEVVDPHRSGLAPGAGCGW